MRVGLEDGGEGIPGHACDRYGVEPCGDPAANCRMAEIVSRERFHAVNVQARPISRRREIAGDVAIRKELRRTTKQKVEADEITRLLRETVIRPECLEG